MRIAVLALVAGFAAIGLSLADSSAAATAPITWKVESAPFRISVYQGSRLLVREHTGPDGAGTRLSYRINEGGTIRSLTNLLSTSATAAGSTYTVATSEPDRTATVSVTRVPQGLRVKLVLGPAAITVQTVYEAFDARPDEHFLGTGEHRDIVDLRGQIVPIKVWAGCGNGKPAPFFLSTGGYGVRFATTSIGRIAFGAVQGTGSCAAGVCDAATGVPVVQACFKTGSLSYEVYAGTPEQIVQSYAARAGRPPLPEPSQFAVTKWRDEVGSGADLMEDADRFGPPGFPSAG